MARQPFRRNLVLAAVALLLPQSSLVHAIAVSLCSRINTGASNNATTYVSNSLGYCSDDICPGNAFAITQAQTCWCSDYAPASTVSPTSCDMSCPGYPYEFCGSDSGLFSYVQLAAPVGTQGASLPTTAASSSVEAPSTVVQTIVSTVISNNIVYKTTAIYRTSVISFPTPSSSSIRTSTVTPSVIKETLTVDGGTRVVTVSPLPTGSEASSQIFQKGAGLSGGAIAGIVIGVVGGLILFGLLLYFCCFRRRKQDDNAAETQVGGGGKITRGSSVLSKVGLLRHHSTRRGPSNVSAGTVSSALGSRPPRLDTDIPEMSEGPSSATTANLERRDSRPLFRDHRLNPNVVGMSHPDTSQISLHTLADNQDYSRPLEVRNP